MSILAAATRLSRSSVRTASSSLQRRTLASTVSLGRNWEASSVTELRKEARERGLDTAGSKAALLSRIQKHEDQSATKSEPFTNPTVTAGAPPTASPGNVRHAHVLNPPTPVVESAAPAPGSETPGIPPEDVPKFDKQYLDVKIPDLSAPDPEPEIQIPYGPDFWHSVPEPSTTPPSRAAPKLLVVAGKSSHPGDVGHTVHDAVELASTKATNSTGPAIGQPGASVWADIIQDLGLPSGAVSSLVESSEPTKKITFEGVAERTEAYGGVRLSSHSLDDEERKGAWTLGGIIVGAWLLGGIFAPGSVAEEKAHEAKDAASHKAEELKNASREKAEELKSATREKAEAAKAKVVGK